MCLTDDEVDSINVAYVHIEECVEIVKSILAENSILNERTFKLEKIMNELDSLVANKDKQIKLLKEADRYNRSQMRKMKVKNTFKIIGIAIVSVAGGIIYGKFSR